ncbi:MAG TPA: methyltransferase domain-containing protein [Usitatibacter sp.]|nr:methyltransferase domain-containing protein [Usitatibacter sp.]
MEARRRFAEALARATGVDDPRVPEAFARVPRERFLGPGPWLVLGREGYAALPTSDPEALYDDVVVALVPDKRLNNGQPTLHARCLSAARVGAGETVLHVGCGSGYYTAIIAELVGASGRVTAWDVEPALAAAAVENLAPWAQAVATLRDGTRPPVPPSDVIYVSAGCTRPLQAWTDALADGGRLVMPLTPGWQHGGMLLVRRRGEWLDARFLCGCAFIPCSGACSDPEAEALRAAFAERDMAQVRALHFGTPPSRDDAWVAGDGWWLATRAG